MGREVLVVVALILALALVSGIFALLQSGTTKQVRSRVQAVGGAQVSTATSVVLPSIRVSSADERPFLERALRFLRYNPDIPQEQVIKWPFVMMIGVAVATLGAYRLASLVGLPIAVAVGVVSGTLTMRGVFGWQHNRYCNAVLRQVPDAIGLMVRGIRAGLPLGETMRSVAREMPSPIKDEFSRMLGDTAIGRPLDQALMRVYDRTQLPEFSFLAVTLGLQSQTGGNLAETLENLADIVRKRVAMAKRAKTLAAEGRMQAGILAALPFIAALGMSQIQPFYIENFTETSAGRMAAGAGLFFMLLGLLAIRWLINKAGTD